MTKPTAVRDHLAQLLTTKPCRRLWCLFNLLRLIVNEEFADRRHRWAGSHISPLNRRIDGAACSGGIELGPLRIALARYADHRNVIRMLVSKGQRRRPSLPDLPTSDQQAAQSKLVLVDIAESQCELAPLVASISAALSTAPHRVRGFELIDPQALRSRCDSRSTQPGQTLSDRAIGVHEIFRCDYWLRGRVLADSCIEVELIAVRDAAVVWHEHIALAQGETEQSQPQQMAALIAARLDAVAADATSKRATPLAIAKPAATWTCFDCALIWHWYRRRHNDRHRRAQLIARVDALINDGCQVGLCYALRAHLTLDDYIHRLSAVRLEEDVLKSAVADSARAIALDDSDPTCHYIAAICAYFCNQLSAFQHHLTTALQRCPNNAEFLHHGGTLLHLAGFREEADALLERAGLPQRNAPLDRLFRALVLTDCGRAQEALDDIRSYRMASDWYLPWFIRARVAVAAGELQDACLCMNRAHALAPTLKGQELLEVSKWVKDDESRERCWRDLQNLYMLGHTSRGTLWVDAKRVTLAARPPKSSAVTTSR